MSTAAAAEVNPLELSDEDFLKMNGPGEAPEAEREEPAPTPPPAEPTPEPQPQPEAPAEGATAEGEGGEPTPEANPTPTPAPGTPPAEGEPTPTPTPTAEGEGAAPPTEGGDAAAEPVIDHAAFYKQVVETGFKANGKLVQLRSPEEAIQLMQMGANYTKQMQAIAPHRKLLTMLQNNGLTEDKLSFLIDLDKGDPGAVQKLLKDRGIDPMEIDTSVEPAYQEGNHRVSDAEVNFTTALEELGSTQSGKDTIQDINTRWDQASKDLLWDNPQTMAVIHAQREVGIYDRICDEIDRQRTLGTIPTSTTFLQAYKHVGDQLTAANAFADLVAAATGQPTGSGQAPPTTPAGQPPAAPTPVATTTPTPKAPVTNAAAASAASPTRTTPKPVQEFINPLAMSDDEFLKKFEGRL